MKSLKSVAPFYFGSPEQPLFGCYHEPASGPKRNCAVLICQPIGHEYVNCHRALRQLAARFAETGFPVLRFDYYGCGDSSGTGEEGSIPRWLENISTAISEVQRKTGLAQVCLVGLRLGGTLSAIMGAERGDIESLVLWDPVVDGRRYLQSLLSLQKEMLRFRPRPRRGLRPGDYIDILGFPLSHFLRSELEKLDLLKSEQAPAKNVLIIQSGRVQNEDEDENRLSDHLGHTNVRLEHQRLEAPHIWLPTTDGSLLVPAQVLQSVVSWACKIHL